MKVHVEFDTKLHTLTLMVDDKPLKSDLNIDIVDYNGHILHDADALQQHVDIRIWSVPVLRKLQTPNV